MKGELEGGRLWAEGNGFRRMDGRGRAGAGAGAGAGRQARKKQDEGKAIHQRA